MSNNEFENDKDSIEISLLNAQIEALKNEEKICKERIYTISKTLISNDYKWYSIKERNKKKELENEKKRLEEESILRMKRLSDLKKKRAALVVSKKVKENPNKVKQIIIGAVTALALIICIILGASLFGSNDDYGIDVEPTNQTTESNYYQTTLTETTNVFTILTSTTVYEQTENTSTTVSLTEPSAVDYEFDISEIPAYTNKAYVIINDNEPTFSETDKELDYGYEYYSDLDYLGRCGPAIAVVGEETIPTEKRGEIGRVRPSGWHTVKYDNVSGKYLYNRCHLIGYQLSAENANEKNLITGTRYLNTKGMLPFENQVADYIKETDNHVLYRVTPIFEGNNLLASGVQMEAMSIEDDGDGICFNVYCYNVQPDIIIDYVTGNSKLSEDITTTKESVTKSTTKPATTKPATTKPATTKPATTKSTTAAHVYDEDSYTVYITNSGKKFHSDGCGYLKSKHAISKSKAIAQGYEACGVCHP